MGRDYVHARTNVHLINYHLVWCPKRRRRCLTGGVRTALIAHLRDTALRYGWEVIAVEVMPDHVHCFIGAPPRCAVSFIVKILKGTSSRALRASFPVLARRRVLWSPSYFAGTAGNVSSATIERYIAEQRTR